MLKQRLVTARTSALPGDSKCVPNRGARDEDIGQAIEIIPALKEPGCWFAGLSSSDPYGISALTTPAIGRKFSNGRPLVPKGAILALQ
jgi:hypothetical protein